MSKLLPTAVVLLAFSLNGTALWAEERPAKPNVVLILTDDLGWQDVKCYDIDEPSPMETPNIDAFAKQGVMFWQAYSPAPTCAPSRCAILSGNHPARAQKTHVVGGAPPAPINKHFRMMDPWYSGRMPENEMTLAKALRQNHYTTGHCGKWHIAIDHKAFPQPQDVGFDFTRSDRGSRSSMKDRLAGFATTAKDDPFRLDENGYPFHQTNEDALTFLRQYKDKPFFLYYATWLVHAPIHTRSQARLEKYAQRLGVDPKNTPKKDTPGQRNPFYCAMVEELDYYVGTIFDYLNETEDPRWPGHRLSENTYVIFTSDNGGMEGGPQERYTDNEPLARGKISAMEGGTRVPLLIAGPGIPAGVQTDVMANGLDFYPTILSMTGTPAPADKHLDGCDLFPLLTNNPQNPDLVKHADGTVRDSMVWHFPHGGALESTIRVGDYKLIRNYDHVNNPSSPPLELFQLYDSFGSNNSSVQHPRRVDIEEANNLARTMPARTAAMNARLTAELTEMQASYPYYSPSYPGSLPNKEKVCTVVAHSRQGQQVEFTYQENGAKVTRADLIYTLNGNDRYEEWFRAPASLVGNGKVTAQLPSGTTHYFLNLIDENRFLRSYPEVVKHQKSFAGSALSVDSDKARSGNKARPNAPATRKKRDWNVPFNRFDTNQDDFLSLQEYKTGQAGREKLEQRFNNFDKNQDGKVSRDEFVNRNR
ncbi:sulfatase-like hydrolase/transferase [Roseimaritima ulvae]|uniref:Arylsulfatase n=1 Tax=Roseimaritima ulvae TaxID=980254 RepID=A0A5B9QMI4_9BACT|nr:sulfatase-like hydrolase/transferase [Roseimaritima ulvae]QEG39289.1 Arylsulfatase [Roseimaritima ulvae]